MQAYSPFSKPLIDLQTQDLEVLRHASEGWYIEYKEQVVDSAALAKALSAFANTYGGWLFIGVKEESKKNPVAGSFPGLSQEVVDPLLQRMRKSAADHLNPTPYFEPKVFWGPCPEIDLVENHAVVSVWVPRSSSAPHVHKNGKIYRRVSDASEPKPESDRFVLDQLWHRADEIKQYHKKWYEQDPEFSEREKKIPYIRLMLIADPWLERDLYIHSGMKDSLRDLFSSSADGKCTIPFDTIHTTADGFIARQLKMNDPQNLMLTWRLKSNFESDVIIPLPFGYIDSLDDLEIWLNGYSYVKRFKELVSRYNYTSLRIVDLNYIYLIFEGVAFIQERLCELLKYQGSYLYKIKLLNSWRTVPYIDTSEVIEEIDTAGLSMCLDSVASTPYGTGPDRYNEIDRCDYGSFDRLVIQSTIMFTAIQRLYGLHHPHNNGEPYERIAKYYNELSYAGARSLIVQKNRNSI